MNTIQLSSLIIVDSLAWGWVAGADHRPVSVHLYADGHHVATECTGVELPARIYRQCGKPPAAHAGFVFALPASVRDGFPHDLHAAVATGDTDVVHGATQTYRSSPVCGEVHQQGRQFVGTVWFVARPGHRALLQVADATGKPLHAQPLAVARQSDALGYPANFTVPAEHLPATPLHFACAGQALRGSPCTRTQQLVGVLNKVARGRIAGWALDRVDWQNPLELVLRIDGQPQSWFRPNVRRPDISTYLGLPDATMGLAGFDLPAPALLNDGLPHLVEVVSAADGQLLQHGRQHVQVPGAGLPWAELPPRLQQASAAVRSRTPRSQGKRVAPLVSVIILNRNGAAVLQAFLESWATHNTSVPSEILVVDHGSTDGSLALLRKWRSRCDLQVLALDHNDSFAASSNLGARHARGQYLLFMNNDIVWQQDALPRMLESLQNPAVGVVGIKLLKALGPARNGSQFVSEVQHLGVRFKLNDQGYWPFEIQPAAAHHEAEHAPQPVPAVTGAVLLCRKADFEAVGGFDPAYFYGFEDVELCLRLAHRLHKTVVCRNDCVALHHHGHTRLSGREMSVYDRVLHNSAVLEAHIGVWIKQAYWHSLIAGDGYITREPLTIGIVVDAMPQPRNNTPLVKAALALAAQLRQQLPHAQLVLLPPERDWKHAANLHVLVVGDTRYDIRSLHQPRPDLLTVAWLRGKKQRWQQLAWWDEFAAVLDPAAHTPLAALLGPQRWRLRVVIETKPQTLHSARQLQAHLRAQHLPCWVRVPGDTSLPAMMADVCITIGARVGKPRAGVLHVAWRAGKVPMPGAAALARAMEKRVGSTFRSS